VKPARRGQASVEYLLLICAMITVACVTGYFLKNYADALVEKVGEKILDALIVLAFG